MSEELKPCPCCASSNIVIETYTVCVEIDKERSGVVCRECGLNIAKDTRNDAIEAWNRRVEK